MKPGRLLPGLISVALLAGLGYLWLAPGGLKTSPDITLLTIDGEELPLRQLRGKPLLVTFWSTTCSGCIREMPHLIELYRELSPQGLEIVGIAMDHDPPSRVLAMRKSRHIPYTLALDINAEAARAFGDVRQTPTSFLIDPNGGVVYRRTGPLNTAALRRDILALLASPGSGRPAPAGRPAS
ncbi:MAG: TlpA disulfide reductase family protein [Gammaproteobacteria bacterium]|jgi:peroxiredoxin